MTTSQVKIWCGEILVESNYPKEKKLQLLESIKNATEEQLLDIVREIFIRKPTREEMIVYKKHLLEKRGPVGSVGGMSVYAMPTWIAWRNLKGVLHSRMLQCKQIADINKKNLCLDQAQTALFESQLKLLKTIINNDCPFNENVDLCRRKGIEMTRNIREKLDRQLERSKKKQEKGLYEY